MSDYLTTQQVATELGVSRRRVQALIKAGRLKATLFGQSWAIRRADLRAVRERVPGRPPTKK